jgi:hypothetical protein
MAALGTRIQALEASYITDLAVVLVNANDGETKAQAEQRYEREHGVDLSKCKDVRYIIDNIK